MRGSKTSEMTESSKEKMKKSVALAPFQLGAWDLSLAREDIENVNPETWSVLVFKNPELMSFLCR